MSVISVAEAAQPALTCPDCSATALTERGAIPSACEFAGQPLDHVLPGGHLYECRNCSLCFRSPLFEPAFYDALYARARSDEWDSLERRIDHERIAAALQRHRDGGDVLDIGCGTGALLARLPPTFGRHGVEIGEAARAAAERSHVELLGRSFSELNRIERRFDAVLAADVIEHHPHPAAFVDQALALLKPGGLLILSTGNPDAWLWRWCGGRYWYCQFAEHLRFVSPRWLARRVAGSAQVVAVERFAYAELSPARWIKLAALLMFYWLAPTRYNRSLAQRRGWRGKAPFQSTPPGTGLCRDHFVAVVRKPA